MEFLLEILTEELPASHVRTALEQLGEKFGKVFADSSIGVRSLKTYGSCRRLVVVADVAAGQTDSQVVVTGPPKSVGIQADGTYTQAAKGFAASQGVPVESLEVIQTPRGEYLGLKKLRKGKSAEDILGSFVPGAIASLTFPKTMRWRESPFRFSRPIKNLLALCDGKILPFTVEGIDSGDRTFGHPILSPGAFKVESFADYREGLKKNRVILDAEERRKLILSQIEERLAPLKAKIYSDDELLVRMSFNVECPYVLLGTFPEKYLELPIEVLATAMKEGQQLFSVVKDKKQLPYFLGIADSGKDSKSLIRKGNERVLKARLEDARFFWGNDRKTRLSDRASGLKNVVFQEKLGSYDDKAQRLKKIAGYLCDKTDASKIKKETVEAAGLCKVDLLTDMVKEFPALQGKMGGLYAKAEGYPAAVHQAIYEHYLPSGLDDTVPASSSGALVSLADKIDSIVGVVGVGIQASGSSDPFGLRRNAHGIVKILIEKKIDLSFSLLLDKVLAIYGDKLLKPRNEVKAYCREFFAGRVRYVLEREGLRYDHVSAAIGSGMDNLHHVHLRAKSIGALSSGTQFEPFILMAKRINNILKDQPSYKLNPDLFVEKEERDLHSSLAIIGGNVEPMLAKGDFARAQNIIFKIQPSLNMFFEKVLVMAEDKKIRQNRLALLQSIQKLLLRVADYSQVVVEGEKAANPLRGNPRT